MITRENKKYAIKLILDFGRKEGYYEFKAACIAVLAMEVEPELVYEAVKEIHIPCNYDKQLEQLVSELEGTDAFERLLICMHETGMKN